jgi:hypothetical protein
MKKLYVLLIISSLLIISACGSTAEVRYVAAKVPNEPAQELTQAQPENTAIGLTQQGIQAAKDFLRQYQSIFSIGFEYAEGDYRDFSWGRIEARPLVTWRRYGDELQGESRPQFFCREGNLIKSSPFINGEWFAMSFYLYDFNRDGFAEIEIIWASPDSSDIRREMFYFINGEYVQVQMHQHSWFFHTPDGQAIVLYTDFQNEIYGYYYLVFTEGEMRHVQVEVPEAATAFWRDFHWNPSFHENPVIMGTDIPLTPIQPLTGYQDYILEALRESLGVQTRTPQIGIANEERLRRFDTIHEMDYALVRAARGESQQQIEEWSGGKFVIWSTATMRDISLISLEHDFTETEIVFIPANTYATLAELLPGDALVVTSYMGVGTLPLSGISYTCENNTRRYFAISDGSPRAHPYDPPFTLREFAAP